MFVIGEAGMVGSRQLARFVSEAEARGAKIVLVGDHEQLQAIGAGAPFRALSETIGHAGLSGIRRQRQDWQREASVAFATHRADAGLQAYADHGDVHFAVDDATARGTLVDDYLADLEARPDGTRVAMADRHPSYVAMTRHRDRAGLYASHQTFRGLADLTAQLGRSGVKENTADCRQQTRSVPLMEAEKTALIRDACAVGRDGGTSPASAALHIWLEAPA